MSDKYYRRLIYFCLSFLCLQSHLLKHPLHYWITSNWKVLKNKSSVLQHVFRLYYWNIIQKVNTLFIISYEWLQSVIHHWVFYSLGCCKTLFIFQFIQVISYLEITTWVRFISIYFQFIPCCYYAAWVQVYLLPATDVTDLNRN